MVQEHAGNSAPYFTFLTLLGQKGQNPPPPPPPHAHKQSASIGHLGRRGQGQNGPHQTRFAYDAYNATVKNLPCGTASHLPRGKSVGELLPLPFSIRLSGAVGGGLGTSDTIPHKKMGASEFSSGKIEPRPNAMFGTRTIQTAATTPVLNHCFGGKLSPKFPDLFPFRTNWGPQLGNLKPERKACKPESSCTPPWHGSMASTACR